MEVELNSGSLGVIKSLASETRIKIIELLSINKMNISEISRKLKISNAIVGKHISELEKAGLIKTEIVPAKSGTQKIAILKVDTVNIHFPKKLYSAFENFQQDIPIGHFSDYYVTPTCGLATLESGIGLYDDPKYFMDTRKNNAAILWFTTGFVEYKIPNLLSTENKLEMIDISFELSSEFPYSNNVWPSDISFSLNDVDLGHWTSPGDFSDTRGQYTPDWWPSDTNQYGILVTLRITKGGTYVSGKKISLNGLEDIILTQNSQWKIRLSVKEDAENVGGLTIFGKGFGNHDQNILLTTYYS